MLFGQLSLAAHVLERALQFFCEGLKHDRFRHQGQDNITLLRWACRELVCVLVSFFQRLRRILMLCRAPAIGAELVRIPAQRSTKNTSTLSGKIRGIAPHGSRPVS